MVAVLAVLAACLVVSVTFTLFDTDFWHHLLVGKVIWQTHSVPTRQIWCWGTYGTPEVNSAWLFRAILWPLWSLGGVTGLFVWRWITTLVVFALLWATGRRMGARGFAALVPLLLCGLLYRLRSQVRPDTMVAILIGIQMLILETRRRAGAPDRPAPAGWAAFLSDGGAGLIAIAWIWANTHLSYYVGFLLLGAYLVDDWVAALLPGRAAGRAEAAAAKQRGARLLLVILAAAATSFVNPFGWRALWQPFEFFFTLRHELMYRTIKELEPVTWSHFRLTTLPVLFAGWPLLVLWRAFRRTFDRAEILICVSFTWIALTSQRFIGYYSVAAAPFLMRDLDEWIAARRWPAWSAPAGVRAAITAAVLVAASVLQWREPGPPFGIDLQWDKYPVRACDFIAASGIRGRGFNNFEYGGYQAWRFWPDLARLPFMTGTPEAATKEDRFLYAGLFAEPRAWRALDQRHHFDYILLKRLQEGDDHLLDVLDADTTWALVFADDAAAVFVRRGGPLQPVADRYAFRYLPAGLARLDAVGAAVMRDSTVRARVVAELERQIAASRWNANALSLLANIAFVERHYDEARALLLRAFEASPEVGRGHDRLGLIALAQGHPREALEEFMRERARDPGQRRVALHIGQAWRALGDAGKARTWYRRELDLDPGNGEARDSLEAVGGLPGR